MSDEAAKVTLRPVTGDDLPGVASLHEEVGFSPLDASEWGWLWDENPVCQTVAAEWPRGWVLEHDGRVVGYVANLPLAYSLGERDLTVAVPRALSCAEAFASQGLRLLSRYFKQRGPDLLLCTTANSQASPIFDAFRAKRVPQPGLDSILFWPLTASAFIAAGASKFGVPGPLARTMGAVGSPLLRAEAALSRRGIRRSTQQHTVSVIAPEDIDGAFDDLWRAKRRESAALRVSRSSETLRWHLAGRPTSESTQWAVFKLVGGSGLRGYAVSETRCEPHLGLTRTHLVDLVALEDDQTVIRDLLWHVQEHARTHGSDLLEAMAVLPAARDVILSGRPFQRSVAAWSYFYKCRGPLREELELPERWALTAFDGDTSL